MTLPHCAYALEWWLKEQGKFCNGAVGTQETEDGFVITYWNADCPVPTEAEILQIISDYEADLIAKQQASEAAETNAINKLKALGLTDEEIAAIRGK